VRSWPRTLKRLTKKKNNKGGGGKDILHLVRGEQLSAQLKYLFTRPVLVLRGGVVTKKSNRKFDDTQPFKLANSLSRRPRKKLVRRGEQAPMPKIQNPVRLF